MKYNFTPQQKELIRWLNQQVKDSGIDETFYLTWTKYGGVIKKRGVVVGPTTPIKRGIIELLHDRGMVVRVNQGAKTSCTITAELYRAVESDFAEEDLKLPISTLAQPHPPEIAMSLDRLRAKYPDAKKLGFLIMRFAAAKPFQQIVNVIKQTAEESGLVVIRADENEFHADLWGNVRTQLHGCGFGIAVYERIETDEPNANVGLEVGYLMAMNKPVLLLKDKTVETLQADLAGKLYKPFDPHDPEGTIPKQLTKWFEDYGISVPKRK